MSSLPCNVVILSDDDLANKAISLSQNLASNGTLFTLKDGEFYPHVSIYMLQLKDSDFFRAQELLSGIAKQTDAINLIANGYDQSKQFFDVEYTKSDVIKELQEDIVAALNPVRDGMRAKDVERMKNATGQALANYQRYGWNTVGELYRPHLTLTRFTAAQNEAELSLPDVAEFSGTFSRLGLFEMGDNGTCVCKIAEFDLQSAI